MIRNLLFAVLLHLTNLLWAQPTGDFTIGFATQDTSLTQDSLHIYFYVPADYDGSTPYKLIIGNHGLGDPNNSMQIRDYLSSTGDSISALVMCPDPYLRNQRRSKLVLNIALDSVTQWFNLDTNEYYIAGYSAGSDVAAQYVLDNPKHKMKGLIWYAPGFFYQPELMALDIEIDPVTGETNMDLIQNQFNPIGWDGRPMHVHHLTHYDAATHGGECVVVLVSHQLHSKDHNGGLHFRNSSVYNKPRRLDRGLFDRQRKNIMLLLSQKLSSQKLSS